MDPSSDLESAGADRPPGPADVGAGLAVDERARLLRLFEVLRESIEEPPPEAERVAMAAAGKPAPLNPLAFGIPLLAVGFFLALIFPPLGLTIMGLGAITVILGVGAAILRSLFAKLSIGKAS